MPRLFWARAARCGLFAGGLAASVLGASMAELSLAQAAWLLAGWITGSLLLWASGRVREHIADRERFASDDRFLASRDLRGGVIWSDDRIGQGGVDNVVIVKGLSRASGAKPLRGCR